MNIIVIGCGAVYKEFYVEALVALEHLRKIKVLAVVDGNPVNRIGAQANFPHAKAFASIKDCNCLKGVDAGLVLTPPAAHCDILKLLARAKINAYCEKPLTTSLEEALEIASVFCKNNVSCKVAYTRRFFPNLQIIRSVLEQNSTVKHLNIKASDGEVFRWPIKTSGIFTPQDPGSGVVWDKACHNLDLINWLSPIKSIDHVYSSCRAGAVPIDVKVNGTCVSGSFKVAVSWAMELPNTFSVTGEGLSLSTKNGLSSSIQGLSTQVVCPGPGSYPGAILTALDSFVKQKSCNILSDVSENIELTKHLVRIDQLARRGTL